MKKKVIMILAVVVCILVVAVVFFSVGRTGGEGGEIGFEATINRVEDGVAYATVTEQNTELFSKKLPEGIMFNTADLDEELKAGDRIYGNYLSGTINGQTVRVVSVTIMD